MRFTPFAMSTEEISRLWTAFQTNYRLSTAYEASVVLIDSTRPAPSPLPVLKRGDHDQGVTAVAAAGPVIDTVRVDLGGQGRGCNSRRGPATGSSSPVHDSRATASPFASRAGGSRIRSTRCRTPAPRASASR